MKNQMVRTSTFTRLSSRVVIMVLFTALLLAAPFQAALAQTAPDLGTADGFAVLAGPAVTLTGSTVIGDVGVWPGTVVTLTGSTIFGTIHAGDAVAELAYSDFLNAYDALALVECEATIDGNLAGQALTPGVYCVEGFSATTGGELTLVGSSTDTWIFKIGPESAAAYLEATNFTVVMSSGETCSNNVYWWVADYVTLTDTVFIGTILAGAAITVTGGSLDGQALAKAAVTLTNTVVSVCEQTSPPEPPVKSRCNQGVGNGPEDCDPGNSNQGDPNRSNDELGGTPGNPGRKGGNK